MPVLALAATRMSLHGQQAPSRDSVSVRCAAIGDMGTGLTPRMKEPPGWRCGDEPGRDNIRRELLVIVLDR